MSIRHCFTVDVEDYFHVQAFAGVIPPTEWERFESRVVANTRQILNLLHQHGVQGTFFVLGWVAERHPSLVREIVEAGHELATHGYGHQLVYQQTPAEFRDDLKRSIEILRDTGGCRIAAYRAPSFSITRRSLWALDILAEEGIEVDSSIFPVRHDNYGVPDAPRFPYLIERDAGTLIEFPPTVVQRLGWNVPASGGGYFRLYPFWLTRRLLRTVPHEQRQSFMFYIHPWEVDPGQPRISAPWRSRFRHYQNLKTTLHKLHLLLQTFSFGTVSEVLAERRAAGQLQTGRFAGLDDRFAIVNGSRALAPELPS